MRRSASLNGHCAVGRRQANQSAGPAGLWDVGLPAVVCGTLPAIAFLMWDRLTECLSAAAAASLLLMFIGIHNAWDIAAWNSIRKDEDPK